jgi:hypothetical protein
VFRDREEAALTARRRRVRRPRGTPVCFRSRGKCEIPREPGIVAVRRLPVHCATVGRLTRVIRVRRRATYKVRAHSQCQRHTVSHPRTCGTPHTCTHDRPSSQSTGPPAPQHAPPTHPWACSNRYTRKSMESNHIWSHIKLVQTRGLEMAKKVRLAQSPHTN